MITNEPGKKAAPDFRVDVKLRDVLVNSSEIRNRSQAAIAVEEGLPEPIYPQYPYPRWKNDRAYHTRICFASRQANSEKRTDGHVRSRNGQPE